MLASRVRAGTGWPHERDGHASGRRPPLIRTGSFQFMNFRVGLLCLYVSCYYGVAAMRQRRPCSGVELLDWVPGVLVAGEVGGAEGDPSSISHSSGLRATASARSDEMIRIPTYLGCRPALIPILNARNPIMRTQRAPASRPSDPCAWPRALRSTRRCPAVACRETRWRSVVVLFPGNRRFARGPAHGAHLAAVAAAAVEAVCAIRFES